MQDFPLLERLIQHFNRLPGIGRKTAQRLAWHLVSTEKTQALEFADCLRKTVNRFTTCPHCLMLTELSPCPICADPVRDASTLCVVETTSEVFLIENMHEYTGKYFVLGHLLSPLEGFGTGDIHADELLALVDETRPQEVILALKPSAEGEATIHFLSELLAGKQVSVTRLSTGIPFGGDLEYTSSLTLANAWKRRYRV